MFNFRHNLHVNQQDPTLRVLFSLWRGTETAVAMWLYFLPCQVLILKKLQMISWALGEYQNIIRAMSCHNGRHVAMNYVEKVIIAR